VAAVLGDLLKVVDVQTYLGQEVLNIYWYRVTSVTGFLDEGYEAIADWFEDNVIVPVTQIQASALTHTAIRLYNMSNGIDFYEKPIDVDGAQTAAAITLLPSYVSIGFKLVRESLVTRNGYKRIGGLFDGQVDGNNFNIDAAARTDIEEAMAADIVLGVVTTAEPVIVKHPIGSAPIASYLYSSIGSAQMTRVGTQNTRKAGRGN